MKPRREAEPNDALGRVLSEWIANQPLPPGFRDQVWRRIAMTEARRPTRSLLGGVRELLATLLPRPSFAAAYVASTLVVGVVAGLVAAQKETHHLETALSARYVQSVNPFQETASQP